MKTVSRSKSALSVFRTINSADLRWALFVLMACILIHGCAGQGARLSEQVEINRDALSVSDEPDDSAANNSAYNNQIATLLVGTLSQLPGFEPLSLTVQVTTPTTKFGEAIVAVLRRAGYGLQRVADDQGRNYVSYARTEITSDIGFIVEYSLTVADVVILRKFVVNDEQITPVSPLVIVGAEPQFIHLFHDSFVPVAGDDTFEREVLFELNDGRQVAFAPDEDNLQKPPTRRRSVTSLIEMNSAEIIDINDYAAIEEVVVEFPTADSKILGNTNKQIIQEIVNGYSPRSDVFTLEGCVREVNQSGSSAASYGHTLLWQKRVKHELMSTGVAKKRIRVNACSGQSREQALPERAVVVTLRRLKPASN